MVHYQGKKDPEALSSFLVRPNFSGNFPKKRRKFFSFLLLCLICSSIMILAPLNFYAEMDGKGHLCSSVSNGTICCDKSHYRFDICFMKGDVRTNSASSSIFLYTSENSDESTSDAELQHEKIKPYTRKWETSTMDIIAGLDLIVKKGNLGTKPHCDMNHDVPALVFSTGGYTGNLFHEFTDGILPLYITSQHLNKKVVFVILEYKRWWMTKYEDIVSQLSEYPPINFSGDNRTHCFPEAIVGLRFHGELSVDSSLIRNASIVNFRNILDQAYWPRIKDLIPDEERDPQEENSVSSFETKKSSLDHNPRKPKLVIMSRNGSRAITNERHLVEVAEKIGFRVQVLRPDKTTLLALVYRVLNSSDVMVGVHGAAMTHFLFLKPGSVLIQIVPLGTYWVSETYVGEPARKFGLKYIEYSIMPKESSLYDMYEENDPVLRNPNMVKRGWKFTKEVYLDSQTVRLDLQNFQKYLVQAYEYTRISQQVHLPPQ